MIFLSLIYFLLLNLYGPMLMLAILISNIDISDIDAGYVKIGVWETTLR